MSTQVAATNDSSPNVPLPVRILRSLKPVVLSLLGSRLHPLLSKDILVMTYKGRRSGRRYELPLSFVNAAAETGVAYLCTRPKESGWWRNLQGGADVELLMAGRTITARAEVLDSESQEALCGLRSFLTRNPGTGKLLYEVERDSDGPDEKQLAASVLESVVVRLDFGS